MEAIFLVIHVLIAVALIAIVLFQRSSSDGFGMGSGGSSFMSGRQTANLLTRTTAILATLFILNSLWLSILATNKERSSLADEVEAVAAPDSDTQPIAVPQEGDTMDTPETPADETPVDVKDNSGDLVPSGAKAPSAPSVPAAE